MVVTYLINVVSTAFQWTVGQVQRPFRYFLRQEEEVVQEPEGVIDEDEYDIEFRKGETLQKGQIVNHYVINAVGNTSPLDFLNSIKGSVITFLDQHRQSKVSISLVCEMVKVDTATGNIVDTDDTATFRSYLESVFESTDLEEIYQKMSGKILESFATYLKNGSGCVLKRVVCAEITTCKLRPLRGSSYLELPKSIN